MGLDIHGWIEITHASEGDAQDDAMWMGVTRLEPLVDVPDAFSEAVFGFSKRAVATPADFHPLASGRGIPTACSAQVRDDIAILRDHERRHGPGEFGGFTFVSYAELLEVNWDSMGVRPHQSEWRTVFRVLEALGSRFDHDKIRLVVWWDW
jgi:hypothetical protein